MGMMLWWQHGAHGGHSACSDIKQREVFSLLFPSEPSKQYFKFLFIYLFIVHLSGCAYIHSGTTVCMWRSEDDNMLELALSFHFVGPQN